MPLLPTQVTFRGLEPSPLLEAEIDKLVRRLEHGIGQIASCRVVLDVAREHHNGRRPEVRVEVTFPALEPLVVQRQSSLEGGWSGGEGHSTTIVDFDEVHRQIGTALLDAFDAVRRRLQDVIDERREAKRTPRTA